MAGIIKVKNYHLVCFDWDSTPCFESYEVSKLLGYAQHGSLRKQTLSDGLGGLDKDRDYFLVHKEYAIRDYEAIHEEEGNGTLRPVKPSRGRLFFNPRGLLKVLNHSSKPTEELRAAMTRAGHFEGLDIPMIVKDEPAPQVFRIGEPCARCKRPLDASEDCPCTPAPKRVPVNRVAEPPPVRTRDERMFEYEVMQKLLGQMERLDDPQLKALAVSAAEIALGRKLPMLTSAPVPEPPVEAPTPPVPETIIKPLGPMFTQDTHYSMTRIGELAGGYTAKQAGVAANIVGKRLGYSPDQIRNEQLPINELAMRPDSSTGKKRQMVRFSKSFANSVVHELRTNEHFQPALARGIPTLPTFGGNTGQPILSRGPFDS